MYDYGLTAIEDGYVCFDHILKGDDEYEYQTLIESITSCDDDDGSFLLWLKSLQLCTHILSKEMDVLVGAILRCVL